MQSLRISGQALALLLLVSNLAHSQQSSHDPSHDASAGGGSNAVEKPPLSVDQVARNLEQRDEQRAAELKQFSTRRVYRMMYRGFPGTYQAQIVVDMVYRAPNVKEFKIVSQSGSTFVIDHVFKKLMAGEQEFINDDNRQQNALSTDNYNFAFAGYENTPNGPQYVLNISPKKKNRFLYRGKIWVDAKDFAVVRIEAEPAQNPSIWIKHTEIEHKYMKVGDFWLPAADHTQSEIRLGGEAVLSIEYKDYKITKVAPIDGVQRARADSN